MLHLNINGAGFAFHIYRACQRFVLFDISKEFPRTNAIPMIKILKIPREEERVYCYQIPDIHTT